MLQAGSRRHSRNEIQRQWAHGLHNHVHKYHERPTGGKKPCCSAFSVPIDDTQKKTGSKKKKRQTNRNAGTNQGNYDGGKCVAVQVLLTVISRYT